jgi:hypothetical protein
MLLEADKRILYVLTRFGLKVSLKSMFLVSKEMRSETRRCNKAPTLSPQQTVLALPCPCTPINYETPRRAEYKVAYAIMRSLTQLNAQPVLLNN